jgi:hypothetical protein
VQNERLAFASVIRPSPYSEISAILLANSIRSFAGRLSQSPIYFLAPNNAEKISQETKTKLSELNIIIIPFDISDQALQFPLAADVIASSVIENILQDKTDLLVWLGTNTIVLQEPKDFLLPPNKKLGYCPVHHINIGSLYEKLPDQFWTLVYKCCDVSKDRIFPMTTHIDTKTIRPYFNSGILITRPKERLFKRWHDLFLKVYQTPELLAMYKQDNRYAIFIHQAILSGVILNRYFKDDIQELPHQYNYPLHLYNQDITQNRPKSISKLITVRYESFDDLKFSRGVTADEKLRDWIADFLPK